MEEVGLAEAVFDNEAEWPDELAFHQGEILRVLDQNPAGGLANGWWLCSDQSGNRGIAPANRLRLIHKFHRLPGDRVITPRRFGDVFLYNDSLFPEADIFGSNFHITSGYDVPVGLSRIRLLHDSSHPLLVGQEENGRSPVVREVPIRVEKGRSEERAARTRRSPPQRKYFYNFANGSSSEQDQPPPVSSRSKPAVQWRDAMPQKSEEAVYNSLAAAPASQQRISNASTVSLSPAEESERSSSLSESSRSSFQETYDVPPALQRRIASSNNTDYSSATPTPQLQTSKMPERSVIVNVLEDSLYDAPRLGQLEVNGNGASAAGEKIKQEAIREPTYDIPKTIRSNANQSAEQLPADLERLSVSSIDSRNSDYQDIMAGGRLLRLTPEQALSGLFERQQELESVIERLCSLSADKTWRRRRVLQHTISALRESVNEVCRCLVSFLDFCKSALVNLKEGAATEDKSELVKKLAHLLRPMCDSEKILEGLRQKLSEMGWTLAGLSRELLEDKLASDPLDQFIAVGKQLLGDCRQVVSFIRGNLTVIFQEENGNSNSTAAAAAPRILLNGFPQGRIVEEQELESSASEAEQSADADLFDDYDFIDSRKVEQAKPFSHLPVESNGTLRPNQNSEGVNVLTAEDKQIVEFYVSQVNGHMEYLSGAIEGFLTAVEENQPPRVFVGKSKLVVLAAHKLVYIGDSIAQCLQADGPAKQTKSASDKLCQVLKDCVSATKGAAVHFPAISYIQAMVDSMVSVSHVAHDLKLLLRQLAV